MIPLLQSRYESSYPYDTGPTYEPYGGIGLGLNLLCGIAAAIIVSRKGHSGYQVALHCLFGIFCCGIGALISALVVEDLTTKQRLQMLEDQANERRNRDWRMYQEQQRALAQQQVESRETGQIRCPRCGTMNASELASCWHCGLSFDQSIQASDVDVHDPRREKWQAVRDQREQEKVREYEELVRRKLDEIRVQCNACRKRFSGAKAKVQAIKACPKCGTTPFDYRVLPKP